MGNFILNHPYLLQFSFAFLINIPLGYIRANHPKFSMKWLFWIHASIPLLILLRMTLKISSFSIPLTIFFAVVGQIIGGRSRKSTMSDDERNQLNQIFDLKLKESKFDDIRDEDVLIALLNMGGPKTNNDVEKFQQYIFADPLLIRFPLSFLFQKLFAWLLITFRLKATKERYNLIGGGSPIYRSVENQVFALKNELIKRGRNFRITYSFNYSKPFPEDTIEEVKENNQKYILPLSLYPHYSKATTGSNLHYLKNAAKKSFPELQFLNSQSYYLSDGYIEAFVDRVHEEINQDESLDDFYLVFSAHGLPLYFLNEGDPYPFQISQTVSKVLAGLKRKDDWVISYQSTVGPLQWLKPTTDDIITELARRRVKNILVIPIAFVGDHIETLCEIDVECREFANNLGITDFRMSKAIESHPKFISALADSIESILPKNKIEIKNMNDHSSDNYQGGLYVSR